MKKKIVIIAYVIAFSTVVVIDLLSRGFVEWKSILISGATVLPVIIGVVNLYRPVHESFTITTGSFTTITTTEL